MIRKFYKIVAYFSNFFSKKRFGYYPRYDYYQTRLKNSRGEQFYRSLITDFKKNIGIPTDTEISYDGSKPISDLTKKDIISIFGKPNYQVAIQNSIETSVFFYKQNFGNHNVKVEFHFFKDNLIFYVYTFSNLKNIKEITEVIKEKYLNGRDVDIINENIIDKNKNRIHIRNSVYFEVYYLCYNKEYIDQYINAEEDKKEKSNLEEKRNKRVLYKRL